MNTAQSKLLAWSAAGLCGAGLAVYVTFFALRFQEVRAQVPQAEMFGLLSDVQAITERADDIVGYDRVKRALIDQDWSGRPVQVARPDSGPPPPPAPTAIPVAQLVRIMTIVVDASDPALSRAVIKYTPEARVQPPPGAKPGAKTDPGVLVREGDRLASPVDHVKVLSITPGGLIFGFDDASRPTETVAAPQYPLLGFELLAEGQAPVFTAGGIPIPVLGSVQGPPQRTQRIGEDRYRVGLEDAEYIGENYAQILSQEVRVERHRDPRTGRYDGIEVKAVNPDSIAAQHGVQSGDVVKKINGHPVSSTQEAISFVKNNQHLYDRWEVEVWNKGQTRIVTYIPPKK